jgi:hypothetical protein
MGIPRELPRRLHSRLQTRAASMRRALSLRGAARRRGETRQRSEPAKPERGRLRSPAVVTECSWPAVVVRRQARAIRVRPTSADARRRLPEAARRELAAEIVLGRVLRRMAEDRHVASMPRVVGRRPAGVSRRRASDVRRAQVEGPSRTSTPTMSLQWARRRRECP